MIGRLVRAMRCEALKLRRRPLGWSPLLASALAAAAAVGWRAVSLRGAAEEGAEALRVLPTAWWALPAALSWGVTAGGLLLLIVAAMTLAEERELGTAKVVFSKPVRRGEIVFAKGAVLLLATIAIVLVALAVGLAVGGALWGFGDVVDAAYPDYVFHTAGSAVCEIDGVAYCLPRQALLAAALTVPPVFALLALALCVGSFTRQTGVSVGIAFSLLLFGQALAWLWDAAAPWIVNSYVRFPTETLTAYVTGESTRLWAERWPSGPPRLALGLIVSGATALLTWSLAAVTVSVRPVLSWLLVASVVGGGLSAHAAEIRFSIHDLRAPGQVWDVRPVDLDGDGARDLVAFVVRDGFSANPRRFLALFYQRDGRFPLEPDQLVEVPPQAVARAVADWEPQRRGAEIGWLTPDGIELWPRGPKGYGGERRVLVRDRGFFDMSSGNQLPSFRDLVADVDGDGQLDVLFPRKREAALWLAGESGARLAGRMPVRFRQSYGNRAKQILLGRFLDVDARGGRAVLVRVNRDRLLDVVTIRERRIACWLQKPGGRFGIDPDWEVKLDLLPLEGGKRDALDRVEVEIVDVDHDGWADCVVYRNTGKVGVFSSLRTQLLYFPGGPRGWRTGRPKQIVNLNGVSIAPVLLDVDNDGRRDLVLSSLRTDLITNVKRALFKSVKVTYYVYRFDRSRRSFEPSPGFRRDIDVDVERIEGGGTVPLAYFWGDYDGDGIRDMLTLATDDEVTIYPGRMRGGGFFSGERRLVYPEDDKTVLQLETSNSLWIEDLDGDGRHDLVFHYWADDYKRTERGKITVVLSR